MSATGSYEERKYSIFYVIIVFPATGQNQQQAFGFLSTTLFYSKCGLVAVSIPEAVGSTKLNQQTTII
jgi:hypothetical protein